MWDLMFLQFPVVWNPPTMYTKVSQIKVSSSAEWSISKSIRRCSPFFGGFFFLCSTVLFTTLKSFSFALEEKSKFIQCCS